jgi:hypothetical protein
VPPAAEVDSGALLAVVEASPPAETLAALRTAIHVARRARRVARLELTQAERAVERVVERSDRGRATWHELDEAEDKVAMARASLQLRDAELVEAKRALAAAARPRLHIVLAPQAGRLLLERAEENSLLSPGARLGTLKTGPRPQRGEER